MILDLRRGAQIVRKIADLDSSAQPTPQTPAPQQQPAPPQPPQQQQIATAEPAIAAPSPEWGDLLVKLLAAAPEDVAAKLISCLDKEVLTKALEGRADPYLKLMLLLLNKK